VNGMILEITGQKNPDLQGPGLNISN